MAEYYGLLSRTKAVHGNKLKEFVVVNQYGQLIRMDRRELLSHTKKGHMVNLAPDGDSFTGKGISLREIPMLDSDKKQISGIPYDVYLNKLAILIQQQVEKDKLKSSDEQEKEEEKQEEEQKEEQKQYTKEEESQLDYYKAMVKEQKEGIDSVVDSVKNSDMLRKLNRKFLKKEEYFGYIDRVEKYLGLCEKICKDVIMAKVRLNKSLKGTVKTQYSRDMDATCNDPKINDYIKQYGVIQVRARALAFYNQTKTLINEKLTKDDQEFYSERLRVNRDLINKIQELHVQTRDILVENKKNIEAEEEKIKIQQEEARKAEEEEQRQLEEKAAVEKSIQDFSKLLDSIVEQANKLPVKNVKRAREGLEKIQAVYDKAYTRISHDEHSEILQSLQTKLESAQAAIDGVKNLIDAEEDEQKAAEFEAKASEAGSPAVEQLKQIEAELEKKYSQTALKGVSDTNALEASITDVNNIQAEIGKITSTVFSQNKTIGKSEFAKSVRSEHTKATNIAKESIQNIQARIKDVVKDSVQAFKDELGGLKSETKDLEAVINTRDVDKITEKIDEVKLNIEKACNIIKEAEQSGLLDKLDKEAKDLTDSIQSALEKEVKKLEEGLAETQNILEKEQQKQLKESVENFKKALKEIRDKVPNLDIEGIDKISDAIETTKRAQEEVNEIIQSAVQSGLPDSFDQDANELMKSVPAKLEEKLNRFKQKLEESVRTANKESIKAEATDIRRRLTALTKTLDKVAVPTKEDILNIETSDKKESVRQQVSDANTVLFSVKNDLDALSGNLSRISEKAAEVGAPLSDITERTNTIASNIRKKSETIELIQSIYGENDDLENDMKQPVQEADSLLEAMENCRSKNRESFNNWIEQCSAIGKTLNELSKSCGNCMKYTTSIYKADKKHIGDVGRTIQQRFKEWEEEQNELVDGIRKQLQSISDELKSIKWKSHDTYDPKLIISNMDKLLEMKRSADILSDPSEIDLYGLGMQILSVSDDNERRVLDEQLSSLEQQIDATLNAGKLAKSKCISAIVEPFEKRFDKAIKRLSDISKIQSFDGAEVTRDLFESHWKEEIESVESKLSELGFSLQDCDRNYIDDMGAALGEFMYACNQKFYPDYVRLCEANREFDMLRNEIDISLSMGEGFPNEAYSMCNEKLMDIKRNYAPLNESSTMPHSRKRISTTYNESVDDCVKKCNELIKKAAQAHSVKKSNISAMDIRDIVFSVGFEDEGNEIIGGIIDMAKDIFQRCR